MPSGRHPYFATAGWLPFAVCLIGAVAVWHYAGLLWSAPLWLACVLIVYLFRDPERDIPSSPLAVVSPSDGTVVSVETVHDPYLDRPAKRIVIDMSHYGVYSTRAPVEARVHEMRGSAEGGQRPHGVWLKTDENDDLVVVMHRGPLRNAPRCYVRIGERVGQGQRCGFIGLGGEVEVYVPENSRIEVKPGSRVRAGSDVIATLVHK